MPARNPDTLIEFATDKIFLIRFRTRLLGLSDNQNQPADCSSQWKPLRQVSALATSFLSLTRESTLRTSATTLERVAIPQREITRLAIRTIRSTDGISRACASRSPFTSVIENGSRLPSNSAALMTPSSRNKPDVSR